MATVEIVTLVCNGCGAEDPAPSEQITSHTVKLDRRRARPVELCTECQGWLEALLEA